MSLPLPPNEEQRLAELKRFAVLDTPPEKAFDDITKLAAGIFKVPISTVTLIDEDRQWFKSCFGLETRETGRNTAFCAHAILRDEVMIVPDALADARFAENPLVVGAPHIRFYAGGPLKTRNGLNLGTLSIIDTKPRKLRPDAAQMLASLAALVVSELELRYEIGERRRTAESLRLVQAAMEQSTESVIITTAAIDLPGPEIVFVNPAFTKLTGYTAEEVIGKTPRLLQGPKTDRTILDGVRADLARHEVFRFEVVNYRKDGSAYLVSSQISPICGEDGKVTHFIGFQCDATERHHANTALQQATEEAERAEVTLRSMTESVGDGIVSSDAGGNIIFWNRAAERIFGYQEAEALGKPLTLIIPERYREAHCAGMARLVAGGQPRRIGQSLEIIGLRKDGSEVSTELTLSTFTAAGGQCFTGVIRDITERLRAASALHQAKEEAERANRAKSEFLSRMSHELRTPLNAILGFAQLLEMDGLNVDDRESLAQISRAGKHLLGLINEVLDIARVEAGRLALTPEPVSVRETLEESLALIKPLAVERGVRLEPLAGELDCEVLASAQRFRQVLLNLLSNAVKFNRDGGSVAVFCEKIEDRLRVKVTDTGRGIAAENIARLFVPFERFGAENSAIEGAGLGLSLSKHLIEAMGGQIGVESTPGEGTTFWVELPLIQTAPAASERTLDAPVASLAEIPRATAPRTLLYIEDNLSNLRLVERILARRPEVKLISAMQGSLGLELARQHRPDLVLLDLHLPDIQGDEILRELRADPRTGTIPVVLISADATTAQIGRLLAAGARDYLTKPIDVRRFLALIDATGPRCAQEQELSAEMREGV